MVPSTEICHSRYSINSHRLLAAWKATGLARSAVPVAARFGAGLDGWGAAAVGDAAGVCASVTSAAAGTVDPNVSDADNNGATGSAETEPGGSPGTASESMNASPSTWSANCSGTPGECTCCTHRTSTPVGCSTSWLAELVMVGSTAAMVMPAWASNPFRAASAWALASAIPGTWVLSMETPF